MMKIVILLFLIAFNSVSYAKATSVEQERLYGVIGCKNKSGIICFENAEYIKEYNLYILNFKVDIDRNNLKGMTLEKYIKDTMGPTLGMLNPKAAKFFRMETVLFKHLLDESEFSASSIVLGMTTKFEGESYVSFAQIRDLSILSIRSKIEKGSIRPFELIANDCERIKIKTDEIINIENVNYCNFGAK